MQSFDIRLQVIWDRLVAACEEQARSLIRAGFSTAAREAADVSAGVFDLEGRMLAQAVTGTPGHINSMANSVKHFLAAYPPETMAEGDSYATNDPWKATGHLSDFTVVSPVFRKGRMIALFACTTHVVDIGGHGQGGDATQVYAEGLFVPIMPIVRKGVMNESLLSIVRANVREPVQVEGDLFALVACNEMGARRLHQILDEYEMDDLEEVGPPILAISGEAMRNAINRLPKGTWSHSIRIDGFDEPIDIHAKMTVGDGEIVIDMEGTSGPSKYGINCPISYTEAYTSFGIKCIVAPGIPNNAATLACIRVEAPEGCIANATFPRAVVGRATIGQMMPDLVFGCFNQCLPNTAQGESAGTPWWLRFGGGQGLSGKHSGNIKPFMVTASNGGGAGARANLDGLSATAFPACVKSVAVEVIESISPVIFWKKELRCDSGGAGRQRGGLGQVVQVSHRAGVPMSFFPRFERCEFPARGLDGGANGAAGRVYLKNGDKLRGKGTQLIPEDAMVIVEGPGGGGFGSPFERDPEKVRADVLDGFVSIDRARGDYGVVLSDALDINIEETRSLRAAALQDA